MELFESTPVASQRKVNILDIILLFLAVMLILQIDQAFQKAEGIDFYQYWGVGQVIRLTDGKTRNPYTHHQQFNQILAQMAARVNDEVHKNVAEFRKDLELQATPFSYFMFSWLPPQYNLVRTGYRYFQMGLFILVISILLQSAGYSWGQSILVGLMMIPNYYPMLSELGMGNFNTTLMLGLTGGFFIAYKLSWISFETIKTAPAGSILMKATLLLSWIGTFALMKPTLLAVVGAFQLFILARFGIKMAIKASLFSIIPVGLMASLPAIRFHSADIWFEWFHYLKFSNVNILSIEAEKGNLSTPLFLSDVLHLPVGICIALIATLLIFSFVLKAKGTISWKNQIRSRLADPYFALASGIVVILGLSPLAWLHYFLLLLVPALVFFHPCHRGTAAPKLAILSILMSTPRINTFPYIVMVSWIPLWAAALLSQPLQIPVFGSTQTQREKIVPNPDNKKSRATVTCQQNKEPV